MTTPPGLPLFRGMTTLAFLIGMLVLRMAPLAAQDDQPVPEPSEAPWRLLLQQQIKAVKSCDLNEVLTFNELELGNEKVLEGRVSCIDGREFTFTRRREHQKFDFELCEPTVC